MPWLELDPSGFYHVAFRFQKRRYHRSLKTRSRREAEILTARLEENIRLLERGRLSLPANGDLAKYLLSDGKLYGRPRATSRLTLHDLAKGYLRRFENSERPNDMALETSTIEGMRIHAAHLERIIGQRVDTASLCGGDLQRYIDRRAQEKTRSGKQISPATIKKEIVTLRTIWNWTRNMGQIKRRFPGRGLAYPKLEAKLPFRTLAEVEARIQRGALPQGYEAKLLEAVFLSLEEVEELLQIVERKASHPFLFPMVLFAAHTGARRSEILRCEIDDIDLRSSTAQIRERKRDARHKEQPRGSALFKVSIRS